MCCFKCFSLSSIWNTLVVYLFIFCVGHVNVAPRHLTAEEEASLSATLKHEVSFVYVYRGIKIGNIGGYFVALFMVCNPFQVIHVLGFDPHAFTHFRDERKRLRNKVNFILPVVRSLFFTMEKYILLK